MSWIFGGSSPPPTPPSKPPGQQSPSNQPGDINKDALGAVSKYSFDSEALERAAKAAKELESSKYAKDSFDLIKEQEKTKQMQASADEKNYGVQIERMKAEQIRIAQEERRKNMEEESKQQKARADYQDHLARRRQEDQLAAQARQQEESLKRQEDSLSRQEQMRRNTVEHEQKIRHENDMRLMEAKLRGKAQVERENRDIRMEQLKTRGVEMRQTVIETVKTMAGVLGEGYRAFISDWAQVTGTVTAVTMLAAGIYGAKYGLSTGFRAVESRVGKPSLIRTTSRFNMVDFVRHPISTTCKLYRKQTTDAMDGIILHPNLEARLREIAIATRYTRANKGFYRNVLMCGPPGTGKTMFAKSLALHSGMEYAIMSGGDVAPMGREGVTAVHKVFDWSTTSRKGVLLFIDEADAFLRKRSQERISEDMRATLNAFLYRTGEQSKRLMMVLASNQPEQLDWAINDRVDEIVEFNLPDLEERERLIAHYYQLFVLQPSLDKKNRITVDEGIDHVAKCRLIATITDGLSGREISKIAVAWQAAAYASESGLITEAILDEKVELAVSAHKKKMQWEGQHLVQL